MTSIKPTSRVIIVVASLILIAGFFVPLWQILMWAPQYPEGLEMDIWYNDITGDVKIISALNHYIGMKHIEVGMFPEFQYIVYIIWFLIGFGLLVAISGKRFMVWLNAGVLLITGAAALIDFYLWGYEYGHSLDPTAAIIVPGMSYQPPLIGTKVLLNFTAFSGPDLGGWFFVIAFCLVILVIILERFFFNRKKT